MDTDKEEYIKAVAQANLEEAEDAECQALLAEWDCTVGGGLFTKTPARKARGGEGQRFKL